MYDRPGIDTSNNLQLCGYGSKNDHLLQLPCQNMTLFCVLFLFAILLHYETTSFSQFYLTLTLLNSSLAFSYTSLLLHTGAFAHMSSLSEATQAVSCL
jgi:hypothetical protein